MEPKLLAKPVMFSLSQDEVANILEQVMFQHLTSTAEHALAKVSAGELLSREQSSAVEQYCLLGIVTAQKIAEQLKPPPAIQV